MPVLAQRLTLMNSRVPRRASAAEAEGPPEAGRPLAQLGQATQRHPRRSRRRQRRNTHSRTATTASTAWCASLICLRRYGRRSSSSTTTNRNRILGNASTDHRRRSPRRQPHQTQVQVQVQVQKPSSNRSFRIRPMLPPMGHPSTRRPRTSGSG